MEPENELPFLNAFAQSVNELGSKHGAEYVHRREEGVLGVNPPLVVCGESACRDHAVHMGMQEQVLTPGVQDANETNLSSQSFGVSRYFEHGGRAGAEKQIIQNPGVAQTERVQLLWQGEHDVEVRNVEEFFLSCGEPALASLRLTLRAVPVPAGIMGDGLMTAFGALIDVPSQRRRAAAGDCPQHAQLLIAQPGALVQESVALLVE